MGARNDEGRRGRKGKGIQLKRNRKIPLNPPFKKGETGHREISIILPSFEREIGNSKREYRAGKAVQR
jgi:hypothetical protein